MKYFNHKGKKELEGNKSMSADGEDYIHQ